MNNSNNSHEVKIKRFGQIQAMTVGSLAHNPSYNRAFNLAAEDSDKVEKALIWLAEQKVRIWIDVVPPLVNSAVLQALSRSDLSLIRFSDTVFANLHEISVSRHSDITIKIVETAEQFHKYAQVLSSAFDIPAEILERTTNFIQLEYSNPFWRLFLATVGEQPASIASMYLGVHAASISTMGTAKEYRNKGLQTAILKACIAYAKGAGAEMVTTQVLPASTSERNTIRSGFQVAYTKAFWGN